MVSFLLDLTVLSEPESEPEFLNPGKAIHHPPLSTPSQLSILPTVHAPSEENMAYYTHGASTAQHQSQPSRTSTPTLVNHPAYNSAIRDRIPLDSTL